MKQHLLITGAVIAALSLAALAAEEAAQAFWGITDPMAQPAIRQWTRAEQQAKQQYDRQVAAAAQTLRRDLVEVQQRLIDAGKLEEAIKVKTAIDELGQGKLPTANEQPAAQDGQGEAMLLRPRLARYLHGTRWKHHEGWEIVFNATDMSSKSTVNPNLGTWAVVSADTIRSSHNIRSSKGFVARIDRSGTTMVEPNGNTWTLISRP